MKPEKRITGNIGSVRKTFLEKLEYIFETNSGRDRYIAMEAAAVMAEITAKINREIAVMLDRHGNVLSVSIGDFQSVALEQAEQRRTQTGLTGVRCIHTHPNGNAALSDLDVSSMKALRLDATAALAVNDSGMVVGVSAAIANEPEPFGPYYIGDGDDIAQMQAGDGGDIVNKPTGLEILLDRLDRLLPQIIQPDRKQEHEHARVADAQNQPERAILVGLLQEGATDASMKELARLAETAGAQIVSTVVGHAKEKDSAHYIGRGKAEEVSHLRQKTDADIVIFNDELSGVQTRNLEEMLGIRVVDRTTLILDIFAGRANSKEGKLQVELAQLNYSLSRLTGKGKQLSRLGGGIGTRGPGEKKLDTDRRHIRRRVMFIEQELAETGKRRNMLRKSRKAAQVPVVALVGYTNAGKSTLMNQLCGAKVFTEDKLFATLDPTARKLPLPDGKQAVLIDTVGFIQKLPHDLIKAFRATLEESVQADVLLHVADASDPDVSMHIETVCQILDGIGAVQRKSVLALNKIDRLRHDCMRERIPYYGGDSVVCEISATTGEGLEGLKRQLAELVAEEYRQMDLLIPYQEGALYSFLCANAKVLKQECIEEGYRMRVSIRDVFAGKVQHYRVQIG